MPKIPPQILHTPFYLYNSVKDAEAGEKFGGTGFFVGFPIPEIAGYSVMYAVTNWHVAVRDGASVIRVNKPGGGVDIFDHDPSEWFFKPGWHDLAALHVKGANSQSHNIIPLSVDMFLQQKRIHDWEIGPGEDVFMLGRFVDHDGAQSNVPAARFGNISTMPQPIRQGTGGANLHSFILDVHSRTGYSGSPVFVYRTHGSDLTRPNLVVGVPGGHFLLLLGIHWGQFPERWELKSGAKPVTNSVPLTGDDRYIAGMSGMTLAIPAWAIMELLEMPHFKKERDQIIEGIKSSLSPVAESAPSTTDENPRAREDFNSLVGAAAKTPRRDD